MTFKGCILTFILFHHSPKVGSETATVHFDYGSTHARLAGGPVLLGMTQSTDRLVICADEWNTCNKSMTFGNDEYIVNGELRQKDGGHAP